MQVQGRVVQVMNTEENNGFKKRSLILATEETSQYPQELNIEFTQGKCDDLNNIMPNQQVKVDINLRGRRWTNPQGETKFFNTIQGWRIEAIQQQQQVPQQTTQYAQQQGFQQQPPQNFNQNNGFNPNQQQGFNNNGQF